LSETTLAQPELVQALASMSLPTSWPAAEVP
jgi:hypothetical protein